MLAPALLSLLLASAFHGEPTSAAMLRALESARPGAILSDVQFIASDEMQGRDTPSPELKIVARYLRARLQRLGWQPGARDGSYFHVYQLSNRRLVAKDTSARISGTGERAAQAVELALGSDLHLSGGFSALPSGRSEGDVVWLGSGAQELFDSGDYKGRVAFVAEPAEQRERQRVVSRARREELAALVLVAPAGEDTAGRLSAALRRQVEGSPRYVDSAARRDDSKERPERVAPANWIITRAAFERALPAAGVQAAQLGEKAQELALRWSETRTIDAQGTVPVENVVGFWPGSDPVIGKETIVVSAHYDHVGVSDGEIYNGADDNGSGTSGLLALAEVLADHGPLRRSVAIIWVSGEEKGLWGSRAWAAAPWLPDGAKAVCDINIDMIGRNAPDFLLVTPTTKLQKHYNGLSALLSELSPLEGFPALGSADEYWDRSDHASFAKLGIPVCFLFSDVHADYHKPGDDWEKIDVDKIRRVVRLVARAIDRMQGESLLPAVK